MLGKISSTTEHAVYTFPYHMRSEVWINGMVVETSNQNMTSRTRVKYQRSVLRCCFLRGETEEWRSHLLGGKVSCNYTSDCG